MLLSVCDALADTVLVVAFRKSVLARRSRLLVRIHLALLHLLRPLLAARVVVLVLMLVFHRQFRRLLSVCGLCCGRVIVLRSGEIALMVIFVPTARHWRPMVHLIQRARIVRLHVTSR